MRVYINRFDAQHIWSVDDGDLSTETQWDEVTILVSSKTVVDLSKRGSKTEPCCWIECNGSILGLSLEGKKIAVIR
jgi:hypothetical protein